MEAAVVLDVIFHSLMLKITCNEGENTIVLLRGINRQKLKFMNSCRKFNPDSSVIQPIPQSVY
jgi:hypothetical protein